MFYRVTVLSVLIEYKLSSVTGSVILSIAYGIDVLPEHDPYVELIEKTTLTASIEGAFGRHLVVGCARLDTYYLVKSDHSIGNIGLLPHFEAYAGVASWSQVQDAGQGME